MEPILSAEHPRWDYGERGSVARAVNDVSPFVGRGEFVGIMGASGSGEDTLLNCIVTVNAPTAGHIRVEGQDVTTLKGRSFSWFRRERLGFVSQDCNLLDAFTAFENIALTLTIRGTPAGEIEGRVKETVGLFGITGCLNKYPYQTSGGQCQRMAAVRVIIIDPVLVLAGEPAGAPDSRSTKLLLGRSEVLNREGQTTILMVTRDAFTVSYYRRILSLQGGAVLTQLEWGRQSRRTFFQQIIGVVTHLGGDQSDVL